MMSGWGSARVWSTRAVATSRSLRLVSWEILARIAKASSALQRRSPIRMPLSCSMTARESMALLICSDRAVVVT